MVRGWTGKSKSPSLLIIGSREFLSFQFTFNILSIRFQPAAACEKKRPAIAGRPGTGGLSGA
ncbi:Uncharacterised protein [Bordetella pertussis]|nr:Uncharacterised protein [Bordetella pertussis]